MYFTIEADLVASLFMSSLIPSTLLMYSENLVILFPTLNTTSCFYSSVAMRNASLITGEKLNGQNYFSWSQSIKIVRPRSKIEKSFHEEG